MTVRQSSCAVARSGTARSWQPGYVAAALLILVVASFLPGQAVYADDVVSSQELIEKLKVRPQRPFTTRGMVKTTGGTAAGSEQSVQGMSSGSVILNIQFAYDSSTLSNSSISQLQELGKALNSAALGSYAFEIAGHTDATGAADYNKDLSYRRAATVKRFLDRQLGVDPKRLVTVGWGEDRPIRPENPHAPDNRRVEVINLGRSP